MLPEAKATRIMVAGSRRKNRMIEYIKVKKTVRVSELSSHFGVAEMTVRRDLAEMEESGIVRRFHGGARLAENAFHKESEFLSRSDVNLVQKQLIAQKALSFLNDGATIYIDGSTTCSELARILPCNKRLTVFTDSIEALCVLRDKSAYLTLYLISGELARDKNTLDGYFALKASQQINVDTVFFSCAGFTDEGITNKGLIGTQVKKTFLKNARRKVLLADSTKYGQYYLYMISTWNDIDTLITDNGLSEEARKFIRTQHTQIIIA